MFQRSQVGCNKKGGGITSRRQLTRFHLGTTTTTYTAIVTTTNTYELFYETTTLPSYAPSSECILTTVTHILPTTRTIIYTQPLSYLPPFAAALFPTSSTSPHHHQAHANKPSVTGTQQPGQAPPATSPPQPRSLLLQPRAPPRSRGRRCTRRRLRSPGCGPSRRSRRRLSRRLFGREGVESGGVCCETLRRWDLVAGGLMISTEGTWEVEGSGLCGGLGCVNAPKHVDIQS